MGIGTAIGEAVGATGGKVIADTLGGIGQLAKDLRAAITGRQDLPPEVQVQLAEIADRLEARTHEAQLAQVELNKIEAASSSVFISGWRPATGWLLAVCLGFYFIPQYGLAAVLWLKSSWGAQQIQPYPVNGGEVLELMLGMLGLSTVRMFEKKWSVAAK